MGRVQFLPVAGRAHQHPQADEFLGAPPAIGQTLPPFPALIGAKRSNQSGGGNNMLRTGIGWVFLTAIFIAALPLYIPLVIYVQGRRLAVKLRSSR